MYRLLILAVCLTAALGEYARFDNYKVYRVRPTTFVQLAALRSLESTQMGFSFWKEARTVGDNADIMVPPHLLAQFSDIAQKLRIKADIYVDNVQRLIDAESPTGKVKEFGWTDYYPLADLNEWLDSLAADHPQVTTVVGGQSYEGRDIKGVKVSYGSGKPGVFIEAGIHAREWISPATVTWILNQLLTSTDPKVRNIAESFDWYIFPSTNPDGYEYTHTTNRLWRKTRKPSSSSCVGTDPNRNWGYRWGTGGSSSNPCSETYAGTEAFSEVETKTLSEYLTSIAGNLEVYLDFHSYSQFLLIPYGTSNPADNIAELTVIANKAVDALDDKYNTKYDVGTIYELIGLASGGSIDWVKGVLGTRVSYAFELRDKGQNGFILPPSQIVPTGEETLDAVVSILEDTLTLLKKKKVDTPKEGVKEKMGKFIKDVRNKIKM